MRDYPIWNLDTSLLNQYFHVCHPPPKQLFIRGTFPIDESLKFLSVVGARHHSLYGKLVCEQLVAGLAGYPIVIISGLAHGIDTVAHTTALSCGLICIGFPGSGLHSSVLYPRRNVHLAEKILTSGGCLISEYPEYQTTAPWIFPMRNRLIAGCAHATLIIECANESGSRITAKLATEYNRDVLAVPGNINQPLSEGPNELIKLGALPITSSIDILYALGIKPHAHDTNTGNASLKSNPPTETLFSITADHQLLLDSLSTPIHKDELAVKHSTIISIHKINSLLTELELMHKIKIVLGVIYRQ